MQLACGASDETAHMQFVEHFAARSHFSVDDSLANVENTGDSVVEVAVRSLDSLAEELGLERLDVLKIDVEGLELDVLRRARGVLSRFRPITQIEFNSWTFLSHRLTLPQDCLDEILATFPFVYVHARFDERLARLSTPVDKHSLLYANVTRATVDNLMCGFTEIAPNAPALAEVWPEFVLTADVRAERVQAHVRAVEARVDALHLEIAALERERDHLRAHAARLETMTVQQSGQIEQLSSEVGALQHTVSWRITRPIRAVRRSVRRG